MKPQNPSFPLMLLAGAVASACGGATEITYVEASGGSAGDGGSGGSSLDGSGGAGGSSGDGGSSNGGSAGNSSSVTSGGAGGGSSSVDSGGMGGTSGGSSVNSGGMAGTSASGGTGGDTGCLATGCPAGEYCDGDTRECNPLKDAGGTCDLSQQCQDLLDCVDGVCCTERECPACQNCGGDGECSITVADAEDVTGAECMDSSSCDPNGLCKAVLGQECYSNEECVSGSCLDGVCCGDSECPECMNCGGDGSCSVPVQDADDITSACNGITTCNYDAECTARWSWVTAIDVDDEYIPNYSTVVGSTFYFADDGDYHIGFDTSSGMPLDPSPPLNDDYCWCGATGVAVSDGYSIYYFGNSGRTWTPGSAAWSDVPGYTDPAVYDGEGTFAVTNGRVYRVSGRTHEDRTSYYDIYYGVWVTDGLAEHPVGGATANACGGAVNGKIYAFGWDDESVSEYDPVNNIWTVVDGDPNAPYGCYWQTVPALGQYLLYAQGQVIKALDTTTLRWEEGGIPLPDPSNLSQPMAMVVGDQLYAVGYEPTEKQIHIYLYTPPDTGVIVDP